MDHATACRLLAAIHFTTSLFPLTVRLIPSIAQIGRLIVRFRRADLNPRVVHRFEAQLQELVRELGRIILEWTLNHLEPHDRKDMPKQVQVQGLWYRRRSKTPNRSVATLFGTITLWRMLYQETQGIEPAIFPLELHLGLGVGLATPALAERAARAAAGPARKLNCRSGRSDQRSPPAGQSTERGRPGTPRRESGPRDALSETLAPLPCDTPGIVGATYPGLMVSL
jgi:hypothetical protein